MGGLFLSGFLLIIYIGLGVLWLQQGAQQSDFEQQIAKLGNIVARPLPSGEKLRAEYDEVNRSLAPMTVEAALDTLVSIAEESGIDIDPAADKFSIPPVPPDKFSLVKIGGGDYRVLSINDIRVQGDDDSVMAFISDLDSGKTLKNMVLKKVTTRQIEVQGEGEEGAMIETVATVDIDIYTKPEG